MKILSAFWGVLAMMAPWLVGGFLLAGVAGVLLPKSWVEKTMGKAKGRRGILNAVLIGVPLPICSCGVLPLTAALRKAGAGKGASSAFLISTPQTGIDSILATYSLMGPVFAVARPLAAILTGLVGGVTVDLLSRGETEAATQAPVKKCCCCCCHAKKESAQPAAKDERRGGSVWGKVREIFATSENLLAEIARPLAIGLLVAAVVTVAVPENFFAETLRGRDYLVMPAMVLIGFPMYVCSTASIPIALSLVMKGISPGAAFVFLMVGPAINAASLATVAKLIGTRQTFAYALVIALGAVLCGTLVNFLPFAVLPRATACCTLEHVSLLEHACAAFLVSAIAVSLFLRRSAMQKAG